MARALSDEEIEVFRDLFNSYDVDKSGLITVDEFAQVLVKNPGKPYSQEVVQQIIREVDPNGDGAVDFNEFIAMMTGRPYPPQSDPPQSDPEEQEYTRAWKSYQPSLDKSITASQFRQLMAELGEPVNDVEVERLINNIDGEGEVSYTAFVHFIKSRGV